jgi:hypothetical protein
MGKDGDKEITTIGKLEIWTTNAVKQKWLWNYSD